MLYNNTSNTNNNNFKNYDNTTVSSTIVIVCGNMIYNTIELHCPPTWLQDTMVTKRLRLISHCFLKHAGTPPRQRHRAYSCVLQRWRTSAFDFCTDKILNIIEWCFMIFIQLATACLLAGYLLPWYQLCFFGPCININRFVLETAGPGCEWCCSTCSSDLLPYFPNSSQAMKAHQMYTARVRRAVHLQAELTHQIGGPEPNVKPANVLAAVSTGWHQCRFAQINSDQCCKTSWLY